MERTHAEKTHDVIWCVRSGGTRVQMEIHVRNNNFFKLEDSASFAWMSSA